MDIAASPLADHSVVVQEEYISIPWRGRSLRLCCHMAGAGPAVVLIHGWGTSWYLWKDTLSILAAAGFRACAPDLVGCGHSDKPAVFYTLADYVACLDGLLTALGCDKPILAGHSLGGHIALGYALTHPGKVSRLVLVAPSYSPLGQITLTRAECLLAVAGVPLLGELAMRLTPDPLLRCFISRPWGGLHCPERLAPDVLDSLIADFLHRASPLVANSIRYLVLFSLPALRRLSALADLGPHLSQISIPTLVVWGDHDALLRPASYPALVNGIAGAIGCAIADAGHSPHVEAPQQFHRALLSFLP